MLSSFPCTGTSDHQNKCSIQVFVQPMALQDTYCLLELTPMGFRLSGRIFQSISSTFLIFIAIAVSVSPFLLFFSNTAPPPPDRPRRTKRSLKGRLQRIMSKPVPGENLAKGTEVHRREKKKQNIYRDFPNKKMLFCRFKAFLP